MPPVSMKILPACGSGLSHNEDNGLKADGEVRGVMPRRTLSLWDEYNGNGFHDTMREGIFGVQDGA